MALSEMCDMCGQAVMADEAMRAEMMTTELMCPVSMTLHPDCYERGAEMWQIDTDSACGVDADLPGLGYWTALPHG